MIEKIVPSGNLGKHTPHPLGGLVDRLGVGRIPVGRKGIGHGVDWASFRGRKFQGETRTIIAVP
jgi:hypothetical protein